jgi:hypothetical protein
MKPNEIKQAVGQLRLGELRRLQAETRPTADSQVEKRVEDLALINPYLAEMAARYDEGDSKVASVLYAEALTLFCREFWKPGLVYTEPIKVGDHTEEGIGSFDVRAQLVMYTDTEGLSTDEYVKPNQRYDIHVSLDSDSKAILDVQSLMWGQGKIEVSPDFIDWAKLILESAQNPNNAPVMYTPNLIERVDSVNDDGLRQVWVPRVSPIEDPGHMLQYLKEQRENAPTGQVV